MKKVIFINHTNDVFGAESVLLEVLRVCQLPSSQVLVVEPNYRKDSKFANKVNHLGYNVLHLDYKNIGKNWLRTLLVMLYNIPACLYLCRLIKKGNYTTVYSNTSVTCLGVMLACLCRLEHFWHIHEPVEREHGFTEGIDFLYKAFFRTTNHVFFAARKQQQQWQMRFPALADKSGVLYNPVCEFEHTVCSRRECWFGYLGSRAERKNIPSLIRAFAKLYTTHPDIRLLLSINDGEDDEKINQMIIDLNLESVIHQRVVMNVSDFYNDIDVFVLPSYSETWGMVVLEAMQHGIATIVTTHTGLSELLQHEKHTLFIDPYSMNSICDAMARMTDNQFRTQIGAEGQALILQYRFNELFQTTIRKYLHG